MHMNTSVICLFRWETDASEALSTGGFTCKPGLFIEGIADIPLSTGKNETVGFSKDTCESECTLNALCLSFVFRHDTGYVHTV